ncbi:MAG: hypothetical protein AAGJ35_15480, partial [Myxococcota bacterium]
MVTEPCVPTGTDVLARMQTDDRPVSFRTPLYLAWTRALADFTTRTRRSGKLWDKANMLLEIAYRHKSANYYFLHASVTFSRYLPTYVIEVAVEMKQEEASLEEEETGRLPLSLYATSGGIAIP